MLVARDDRFGDGGAHVAVVDVAVAELRDAGVEARVADRGRPHVNPASAGAEIEGGADDGDLPGQLQGHGEQG